MENIAKQGWQVWYTLVLWAEVCYYISYMHTFARNTKVFKICLLCTAIFSLLYHISLSNLAISLNLACSFRKFLFCRLNKKLVCYAKSPFAKYEGSSVATDELQSSRACVSSVFRSKFIKQISPDCQQFAILRGVPFEKQGVEFHALVVDLVNPRVFKCGQSEYPGNEGA